MSSKKRKRASRKIEKMEVHDMTWLLERMHADCSPGQYIREFTQNCIQAFKNLKSSGSRIIEWGFEIVKVNGQRIRKLTIADNGCGMSGEELIRYIKMLASSKGTKSFKENYGLGARIAGAPLNTAGLQFLSWDKLVGKGVVLCKDPDLQEYGLKRFEQGDGKLDAVFDVKDSAKPKFVKEHGTKVVFMGMSEDEDTTRPAAFSDRSKSWLVTWLNRRYHEFPKGILVLAPDFSTPKPKTREVTGMKAFLDAQAALKGDTKLSNATVHWWVLNDAPHEKRANSDFYAPGPQVAALYQSELYEMVLGRAATHRLTSFGVTCAQSRIVIYVEPTVVPGLTTDTARTCLLLNKESLDWPSYGIEFRQKMPKELREFLEQEAAKAQKYDFSEALNERMKKILEILNWKRFRLHRNGECRVDTKAFVIEAVETNVPPRRGPEKERKKPEKVAIAITTPKPPKPPKGPEDDSPLYQFIKKRGEVSTRHDPRLPKVDWISTTNGSREAGFLDGRAACYLPQENRILANADLEDFRTIIAYIHRDWEETPGSLEVVKEAVYFQITCMLIEAVVGILTRSNSEDWNRETIDRALSQESLTAAVQSRFFILTHAKQLCGTWMGGAKGAPAN